jgi:Protein of unknown function (DUF2905)
MGRLLLIAGLIVAAIGLAVMAGVPLGRLPGDLVIRRGNATFYLPITTCIVLSVLLTIVLSLFRR